MVIVSSSGGSNIGFISRQVDESEIFQLNASGIGGGAIPSKKILSLVKDGDETVRNILHNKLSNEFQALEKCQMILRGHRSCRLIEIFATEFQFDNKKLAVFLIKHGEISVCRLVRKLYESFKMKIKVVEVSTPDILEEATSKYFALSNLDSPLVNLNQFQPPAPPIQLNSSASRRNLSTFPSNGMSDLDHTPLYRRARSGTYPTMGPTEQPIYPPISSRSYDQESSNFSCPQPVLLGPATSVPTRATIGSAFEYSNNFGQKVFPSPQNEFEAPWWNPGHHLASSSPSPRVFHSNELWR